MQCQLVWDDPGKAQAHRCVKNSRTFLADNWPGRDFSYCNDPPHVARERKRFYCAS